jgi:hypothetical protein
MLGLNPGLLRCWQWQSKALTIWLELIYKRILVVGTTANPVQRTHHLKLAGDREVPETVQEKERKGSKDGSRTEKTDL